MAKGDPLLAPDGALTGTFEVISSAAAAPARRRGLRDASVAISHAVAVRAF
jgi:hypothetical protein